MQTTYYLAPLAGYTDVPFRMLCRAYGLHYAYTALIDAGALVHGNRENSHILKRAPQEPWLGVQLLGSIPHDIRVSAEMLEDMDYDAVDFNMGCPMAKVVKRPAGAALMHPDNQGLALECVRIMRSVITRPLTVKLRILDYEDPAPTVSLCRRLEDCGVDGITIHGRSQKAIYSGPVSYRVIEAVREAVRVPVTANGGVFGVKTALAIRAGTGCERVMVARGAIGNPWIFQELREGKPHWPSHEELCGCLERHVLGMVELYGEREGLVLARKIIVAYLHGRGYSKAHRVAAGLLTTLSGFREFMKALRDDYPRL